jgi:hypothetical protein
MKCDIWSHRREFVFFKLQSYYSDQWFQLKELCAMKFVTLCGSIVVAAMLSGPAMAGSEESFSALRGVDAQVLSVEEMQATTGQVNALDIAAALLAQANTMRNSRLRDSVLTLARYYQTNAYAINQTFKNLGIYTDPRVK